MADLGSNEILYKQTATGSINGGDTTFNISFPREISISFVGVHVTDNFNKNDFIQVIYDASNGPNYDFLLASEEMNKKADFFWQPDKELFLLSTDGLQVVISQLSGATAYVTVVGREA